MNYTQVELTSPLGPVEVWWLPVPEKKAKVGEKITRQLPESEREVLRMKAEAEGRIVLVPKAIDWTITQVCVTLEEDSVPLGSRVTSYLQREVSMLSYMSF